MTEKELFKNQPKQLFKLSNLINKGLLSLDDLSDLIPGTLHVNSRKDWSLQFLPKKGCDFLGYTLEELKLLGTKVYELHQSNYTRNVVYKKLFTEFAKNDVNQVIPFFQDWKHHNRKKPIIFFTSTKILNENQLISISLLPNNLNHVNNTINSVFGINAIIDKYFGCYSLLTRREKEILKFLGQDSSRKEISALLYIDEKTVKRHSENIFSKLGTSKRTELEKISKTFLRIN